MAKLFRIGNRMIDLDAVVAAEERGGIVEIFISGIGVPFRFEADQAKSIWGALATRAVGPDAPSPATPEFSVVEMPAEPEVESPAQPPAGPGTHRGPGSARDPLVEAILADSMPRKFVRSTDARDPHRR